MARRRRRRILRASRPPRLCRHLERRRSFRACRRSPRIPYQPPLPARQLVGRSPEDRLRYGRGRPSDRHDTVTNDVHGITNDAHAIISKAHTCRENGAGRVTSTSEHPLRSRFASTAGLSRRALCIPSPRRSFPWSARRSRRCRPDSCAQRFLVFNRRCQSDSMGEYFLFYKHILCIYPHTSKQPSILRVSRPPSHNSA